MLALLRYLLILSFLLLGGRGSRGGQTSAAAKTTGRGRGGRGRASPAKQPLVTSIPVPNPGSASRKPPSRGGAIQNAFARQSQARAASQRTVLEFAKILKIFFQNGIFYLKQRF